MRLQATKPITVFIDKAYLNQIPLDRRENESWAGCKYTILPGETFRFDRSNNWDRCYFELENGAEFLIWCANLEYFTDKHSIIEI